MTDSERFDDLVTHLAMHLTAQFAHDPALQAIPVCGCATHTAPAELADLNRFADALRDAIHAALEHAHAQGVGRRPPLARMDTATSVH